MELKMVTITESAQEYLVELLAKQEDALGVRVFINHPERPVLKPVLPIAERMTSLKATKNTRTIN